jgi:hypothetical protein
MLYFDDFRQGVVFLEPKTGARFLCTVPECESMFTSEFNLKGHLLSHDKYKCNGCHKQFARMDALNEHLNRRGAEECARAVESAPAAEFPERLAMLDGMGDGGSVDLEMRGRQPQNPPSRPGLES